MEKKDYNNFDFSSFVKIDETSPSGLSWVAPRLYSGKLSYERVGKQAGTIKCSITDNTTIQLVYLNISFLCTELSTY